jgi:hypothetical protein
MEDPGISTLASEKPPFARAWLGTSVNMLGAAAHAASDFQFRNFNI